MSISATSPQNVEATGTEEAALTLPEHAGLSYQPLAIQFEQLLTDLDQLFRTVTGPSSTAIKVRSTTFAKDIDEFIYHFQLWANDIGFRTPTKVGSTAEVLQSLDDSKSPVTDKLQDLFQRMLSCTRQATVAVSEHDYDTFSDLLRLLWSQYDEIRELAHQIRREYREIEERNTNPPPGSVVLCFDGGGIKSYSTLLIVKALMDIIRKNHKSKTLRPRDFFDYMFGSSSGGLIAIMLGRLKMDIDECLQSYEIYADDIFGHPRIFHSLTPLGNLFNRTKYGSRVLDKASRRVVKDFGQSSDGRLWKINTFAAPQDHCRTGVMASRVDPTVGNCVTHVFRTYDVLPMTALSEHKVTTFRRDMTGLTTASDSSQASRSFNQRNIGPAESLPIWIVARATVAAPLYFDAVIIDDKTFLDGGLGSNNPSLEAYNEVRDIHSQNSESKYVSTASPIALFISIGSGLKSTKQRPTGFPKAYRSLIYLLRSVATDTEEREMLMRRSAVHGQFPYFRFNVDKGVGEIKTDEWRRPKKGRDLSSSETLQRIKEATKEYLGSKDVQQDLEDCARLLISLRRLRL